MPEVNSNISKLKPFIFKILLKLVNIHEMLSSNQPILYENSKQYSLPI